MKKIIIWGMKEKAIRICHFLNYELAEIVAFTDGGCRDRYVFRNGINAMPYYEALSLEYDYIVIASRNWDEISVKLQMEGVPKDKIIQVFNSHYSVPDTLFYFDEIDSNQDKKLIFKSLGNILQERL